MDSESDWDTASEAETKSPKRINAHYPKIDGILEVPEENNWNPKVEYRQYTTEDEDQDGEISSRRKYNGKDIDNVQEAAGSTLRQSSAGSSRQTSQSQAGPTAIGDFRSVLDDQVTSKNGYKTNAPGKERKGHLYDPPKEEQASWDSDDDARALADIHAVYKKGKTQEEEVQKKLESSAIVLEIKEPESTGKLDKVQNSSRYEVMTEEDFPRRSGQAFIMEEEEETRIIYPFEEGHKGYYHAVDTPTDAYLPHIADKSEVYIRRCWQEFFAALRILTGFVFIFVVELLLFVMRDTVYKLLVKVIVITGNFLVKPLLSNTFNAFIQPVLIFLWNILTGVRNMMQPVIDLTRSFVQLVAQILASFRLIEIKLQSGVHAVTDSGHLEKRILGAKIGEIAVV